MGAASPSDRSVRVLYTVAAPTQHITPATRQVAISLWGRPADSGAGAELGISGVNSSVFIVTLFKSAQLASVSTRSRWNGSEEHENALLSSGVRGWRGVLPVRAPIVERP